MSAVAAILRAAADLAGAQKTLDAAVRLGWSACHADREMIRPVFEAWRDSEEAADDISALGGTLRRRYETPADIAGSLKRAAEFAEAG